MCFLIPELLNKDSMKLINNIKKKLHNNRFYANSEGLALEEFQCAQQLSLSELSTSEMRKINDKWGMHIFRPAIGYPVFTIYKHYYGFNSEYVPMSFAFPWLLRVLTRVDYARVFVNKGMTYNFFYNVNQPKLVGRVVNNCFFLEKSVVDKHSFIENVRDCSNDMIVKLSTGSCGGHSIKFLPSKSTIEDITNVIDSYNGDFLIQEKVKQHPFTKQFNPTSLNTFRITTLLLNGKFSLLTAMLRFGNSGSVVDNIGSGGGCVGVNDDGSLMEFGYNKQCHQIQEWNGVKFRDLKVPCFDTILETCRMAHFDIPMCALVGWDMALSEDEEVLLIEANIDIPGVFFEQLANARPLFRERFDEVMLYIREHPLPLEPLYDATN